MGVPLRSTVAIGIYFRVNVYPDHNIAACTQLCFKSSLLGNSQVNFRDFRDCYPKINGDIFAAVKVYMFTAKQKQSDVSGLTAPGRPVVMGRLKRCEIHAHSPCTGPKVRLGEVFAGPGLTIAGLVKSTP